MMRAILIISLMISSQAFADDQCGADCADKPEASSDGSSQVSIPKCNQFSANENPAGGADDSNSDGSEGRK